MKMSFRGATVVDIDPVRLESHLRQVSDLTGPFLKPKRNRESGELSVKLASGWLFGGVLKLRPSPQNNEMWSVILHLDLNVTRFVQTQGIVNWTWRGARNGWAVLRDGTKNSVEAQRESLSGTDNLISAANLPDALGQDWGDITQEYVQLVLSCIDRCLNQETTINAAGDRVIYCSFWRLWSVGQAEIYWEATGSDAVSAVRAMGDRARAIASGLDYREYVDSDVVVRTEGNSPSLNLKIGEQVRAAVYAKTFQRVRYEIRYDAKVRSKIPVPTGQASGDDINNLSEFMDFLIEDARVRLSRILPEMNAKAKRGYNERSALVRVLTELSSACGNNALMTYRLITLLSNNGGISVVKNDDLFPAVAYLHETKLLRRVKTKPRERIQRYRLSEPMRTVFAKISTAGDGR